MTHQTAPEDVEFLQRFEACAIVPGDFDHRAHVRLAYIYLCGACVDTVHQKVRSALISFLSHHGIEPSMKYHETLTRAWILAVRHFMANTPPATSAAEFLDANPILLDSRAMLQHYSEAVLFSDEARSAFVAPDILPIPRYPDAETATSSL